MYHISTKTSKPDIGYMEATIEKLMKRGIRVADCSKILKYYSDLRESLKKDIQLKYNIENPNSTQQVAKFIEYQSSQVDLTSTNDILNICYNEEDKKWTTGAEALEKLADLGYDFARDLLDYRHAKKYAESIESMLKFTDADGLVHPRVSLSKTNRINYKDPGLLTIPKKLLWHIIAPYNSNNVLYSVDIKNQEPSILINLTGANSIKYALESEDGLYETLFKECFKPCAFANVMIDTFPENRVYTIEEIRKFGTISPAMYSAVKPAVRDTYYNGERVIGIETICIGSEKGMHPQLPKTVDIETENGNIYSVNVNWESDEKFYKKSSDYTLNGYLEGIEIKVGKAERKEFKTTWNAISYGGSIFRAKMICKTIDAKQTYNFITKIAEFKNYRDTIEKFAKADRHGIGTAFGTVLDAGPTDDWKKLKRILLDLPIQGTGADILSLLIHHFYDYCAEKGLSDKLDICYTRHDELIIEVNGDWLNDIGDDGVKSILKDMLEHQIDNWTPFKVEIAQTIAEELSLNLDDDE